MCPLTNHLYRLVVQRFLHRIGVGDDWRMAQNPLDVGPGIACRDVDVVCRHAHGELDPDRSVLLGGLGYVRVGEFCDLAFGELVARLVHAFYSSRVGRMRPTHHALNRKVAEECGCSDGN